jgi:hypothetical protein
VRDAAGACWFLRDHRLAELRDEALVPWTAPDLSPETPVVAVAASPRGGLWIVMEDRVRRWQCGGWQEDRGAVSWRGEDHLNTMRELASGDLLIGMMRSGLRWYRVGTPPESFGFADGLAHEWVRRVIEDREGNIWVGTAGGLNRLQPPRAAMAAHDWQGAQVRAVAADAAGGLWVGTEGAGLHALPSHGRPGRGGTRSGHSRTVHLVGARRPSRACLGWHLRFGIGGHRSRAHHSAHASAAGHHRERAGG